MKRKTAFLGVMTALALIFSYVESLIPVPIPVPGIKLGLANLMVVLLLYLVNAREAILLNLIRVVLSGFLFGSLSSILYSLAGAVFSFLVMVFLKKTGLFSPVGVSIAGGTAHNLGQILVAALILESADLFFYAPVLMITGEVTGFLIGITAGEILKRLPKERNE
ncbi:MAG: Gx transporter family protein [Candidatus Limivivens sp.]|nr:Gx transporter family protein [Candidatus Limivivens sp.]